MLTIVMTGLLVFGLADGIIKKIRGHQRIKI
jgi:hypothetical protein